jgi:hypothetical protein
LAGAFPAVPSALRFAEAGFDDAGLAVGFGMTALTFDIELSSFAEELPASAS